MAIADFDVTAAKVRAHHFAQLGSEFGTTSNPTATTVGEMVQDAAAELAGKLRAVGVTPSTIDTDAGVTYPEAFAWCAETVRLGAAIRVVGAMSGQDPAIAKKWQSRLDERYGDLEARGYLALGDAPAPSENASGPRSHVTRHNLDVGDTTSISSAEPRFRRDDAL